MPINGTELIEAPWDTVLSPFINLLGTGFYLIPITFIALALYVKTHDTMLASAWLMASGTLLSSTAIFTGYLEMSIIYTIVVALGVTGIVINIFFIKK